MSALKKIEETEAGESTPRASGAIEVAEVAEFTQGAESTHTRIKSLDGLRAVAFLSVFLYHLGRVPGYMRGPAFFYGEIINWGFLGVDLFFVISGYIITALLLDEQKRNGNISIKLFFQRRILRIWPLFYLTLALSAVATVIFAKNSFDFQLFFAVLQKAYLPMCCFCYVMPLPVTELVSKLMEQTRFPVLYSISPLWSVCIEEQFYLIWPWCVAFVKNKRQLVAMILIAVGISEICRAIGQPTIPGFFYLNPLSRVTPLAVGALIAIAAQSNGRFFRFASRRSGIILIGASLVALYVMCYPARDLQTVVVARFPSYPILVIALGSLLFAALKDPTMQRVFATDWLQKMGKYTYCMYLVHFLVIYVTRPDQWTFTHDNIIRHVLWTLISFSVTFAIAKLSWKYIEKPLARRRAKLAA